MKAAPDDRFRDLAREIVGLSKEGRHEEVHRRIPELLALHPTRWEHTNKKAHVLAGMAYDALRQGELEWAARYLQLHRSALPDPHLLPTIVDERRSMESLLRHVAQGVPLEACPRVPRARKVAFVDPDNALLSPMAEAFARAEGARDLHVLSGGVDPARRLPKTVQAVMEEAGLSLRDHVPRRVPKPVLRRFPLVVGMNVGPEAAVGDAHRGRFEAWTFPPPPPGDREALRRTRDAVREAVVALLETRRLRRTPDAEG